MIRPWLPWLALAAFSGTALALVGQGNAPAAPPQFLPITATWCLEKPAQAAGSVPPRCIRLEVPRSDREQAMGLQLRPPLPPGRGMWFPYAPPALARFWMHRTPEPLDMIFVRDLMVVALETSVPPCMHLPCPSYGPDMRVDGVLELAAGQAAALGITLGTPVRITPLPAATPSAPAPD
jgi:uncharacterized membrane protein (UPF0127 family)